MRRFCTLDDSVLELIYKDLYQLYNLKELLISEGLSNYKENNQYSKDIPINNTLQHGT